MCHTENGRTIPCWMETERRKDQARRSEARNWDGKSLSEDEIQSFIRNVFGQAPSVEDQRAQAVDVTVKAVQSKMAELGNMPEEKRRLWTAYFFAAVLSGDEIGLALVDMVHEVASLRAVIEAKERALKTLREENKKAYARINDLSRPLGIRPVDILGKPRGGPSGNRPRTTEY